MLSGGALRILKLEGAFLPVFNASEENLAVIKVY